LDFEPAYRNKGWDVSYDTGDWGAAPHIFTFKKRDPPVIPQPRR
jgi:predicted fused transcriptional regulator/phosphomethylpyrimidine kinase